MHKQTVRDRIWLWGMKVNVLQEAASWGDLGDSTMTVEDAIGRTGVTNVIMAGELPINQQSLDSMPSARRIVCKWSLHEVKKGDGSGGGGVMNYEGCLARLIAAKALAAADTRIEGFLVDDFSTGSITAGVEPEHLSRLQFANAVCGPALPLSGTIYTMSLERPELPALVPHFSQLLVPLWHADRIDSVPDALRRLSELSGGKPMVLCLYVRDFGNRRAIPGRLMDRHLDVAEQLLCEGRVAGLVVCGTCMMDLPWESNRRLDKWLARVGDRPLQ